MQSSPPFSCPAARMPQRACSQATLWYFRWLSCKIPCVADIIILSPVSNICKAVPMALFWVTNILMDSTKKTEKHFKFLFNLTGKLTRAFLTVNRATHSNPGTQVESKNKHFSTGWQTDLARKFTTKIHILKSKSSNVITQMAQSSKLITVNYSLILRYITLKSNFNVNSK